MVVTKAVRRTEFGCTVKTINKDPLLFADVDSDFVQQRLMRLLANQWAVHITRLVRLKVQARLFSVIQESGEKWVP